MLSRNGVFDKKGSNTVYFHYFTGIGQMSSLLGYTLKISFTKAYLSIKSKTNEKGVSTIKIFANGARGSEKTDIAKPVEIKVQRVTGLTKVKVKVKKKYRVEKMSEISSFSLDLLEYFDIQGPGIDINYPVAFNQRS
jgi:hypothetical protein